MELKVELRLTRTLFDPIKKGWPCAMIGLPATRVVHLYSAGAEIDQRYYRADPQSQFIFWSGSDVPDEVSALVTVEPDEIASARTVRLWKALSALIPVLVAVIAYVVSPILSRPPVVQGLEPSSEMVNFYTVDQFFCSAYPKRFVFVILPQHMAHIQGRRLVVAAYKYISKENPDERKILLDGPFDLKSTTTPSQELNIDLDGLEFESGDRIRAVIYAVAPQSVETVMRQTTLKDIKAVGGEMVTWRDGRASSLEYKDALGFLLDCYRGAKTATQDAFLAAVRGEVR